METINEQINSSYGNLVDKMTDWLNEAILQLPNLLIALAVAVAGFFISKYVSTIAKKTANRFTNNKTVLNLISNLSAALFGVFVLFTVLSILNLGETINKILATAGVLGLAVGLALQDPMNNLFSGVFMSVRDLYQIGDLVETNGYFGTIKNIDLRVTKLKLPTGQDVIIPNKDVIQNPLKNYTASGERRIDLECGVSYGDDLEKVRRIAEKAISAMHSRLESKPVDLVYTSFGDSSINFTLRFWITTNGQRDFLIERSKAIVRLKKAFDQEDIMIPFPIRTLDFGIRGGDSLKTMIPKQFKTKQLDPANN